MTGENVNAADEWFAVNFKAAREQAGLSQEAVAAQMRERGHPTWRQQTVARAEAGGRAVLLGEAHSLARIAGADPAHLALPPLRAQEGMALRNATAALRKAAARLEAAQRSHADARGHAERLVKILRERAADGGDLAAALADAELALEGR